METSLATVQTEKVSPTGEQNFDIKKSILLFINKFTSANTRSSYKAHLEEFFKYTKDKHPLAISIEDVSNWRVKLETKPNHREKTSKNSTVAAKLCAVRSYFKFLKAANIIPINPADTEFVKAPPVDDELHGHLMANNEVRSILEFPKRETIKGARDYAILLLMARCFYRVSEVVALRQEHLTFERGSWFIKIKVKGGKEKKSPLPSDVKKAIDDYLFLDRNQRQFIKVKKNETAFVFQSLHEYKKDFSENSSLSSRQVWHIVKSYGRLANIKITPHDFRRTAITRALDMKESYRRVMNAARLKNIQTVVRYDQNREKIEENSIHNLNYDD